MAFWDYNRGYLISSIFFPSSFSGGLKIIGGAFVDGRRPKNETQKARI
jgi:hypothetical protein